VSPPLQYSARYSGRDEQFVIVREVLVHLRSAFLPRTCGYLRGDTFGAQGRTAREGQGRREQLHCLLPSTRSSTSRRFRCICASSGNPVISDSSSSCFAGKILFYASIATPYPVTALHELPATLTLSLAVQVRSSSRRCVICEDNITKMVGGQNASNLN
jgi:hypothetical protein